MHIDPEALQQQRALGDDGLAILAVGCSVGDIRAPCAEEPTRSVPGRWLTDDRWHHQHAQLLQFLLCVLPNSAL